MQTNYDLEMKPANIGGLAHSTFKTVDSYHAEGVVRAGMPVIRGTNAGQAKAVSAAGDAAKCLGIAMHVHKTLEAGEEYYPEGYVIPVVTEGRVWVKASGDVAADAPAKYDFANNVWSAAAGEAVPNAKFITDDENGMAVVQVWPQVHTATPEG